MSGEVIIEDLRLKPLERKKLMSNTDIYEREGVDRETVEAVKSVGEKYVKILLAHIK